MKRLVLIIVAAFALSACNKNSVVSDQWDAEALMGWIYEHQDTATIKQAVLKDDVVYLTTRANTYDRTKLHSLKLYQDGVYTWRTFIPEFGPGDRTSVGSWIYCDDLHEVDFEVGWGTDENRAKAGAKPGEVLACMTNQDSPFSSSYVPISTGWHDFGITLKLKGGNYEIHWYIDGVERKTLQTGFGPNEATFRIYISVENLMFIGNQIASQDNSGGFKKVTFKGTKIQ